MTTMGRPTGIAVLGLVLAAAAVVSAEARQSPEEKAPAEAVAPDQPSRRALSLEDIADRIHRRLAEDRAARGGAATVSSVTPSTRRPEAGRAAVASEAPAPARRLELAWPEAAEATATGTPPRQRVVLVWPRLEGAGDLRPSR